MPMQDEQFVALNLPPNVDFSKNGQTLSVTDAVSLALDATQRNGVNVKELALAMLYDMLSANYPFASQQGDSVQYTKPQMQAMAQYWRERAPAIPTDSTVPGGMSSIPITFPDDPSAPWEIFETWTHGKCLGGPPTGCEL